MPMTFGLNITIVDISVIPTILPYNMTKIIFSYIITAKKFLSKNIGVMFNVTLS
jgi:hypothetical protein